MIAHAAIRLIRPLSSREAMGLLAGISCQARCWLRYAFLIKTMNQS